MSSPVLLRMMERSRTYNNADYGFIVWTPTLNWTDINYLRLQSVGYNVGYFSRFLSNCKKKIKQLLRLRTTLRRNDKSTFIWRGSTWLQITWPWMIFISAPVWVHGYSAVISTTGRQLNRRIFITFPWFPEVNGKRNKFSTTTRGLEPIKICIAYDGDTFWEMCC
jgi:hypothetical protein